MHISFLLELTNLHIPMSYSPITYHLLKVLVYLYTSGSIFLDVAFLIDFPFIFSFFMLRHSLRELLNHLLSFFIYKTFLVI